MIRCYFCVNDVGLRNKFFLQLIHKRTNNGEPEQYADSRKSGGNSAKVNKEVANVLKTHADARTIGGNRNPDS